MSTAEKPCSCTQCVGACERNPGWMSPEDAQKAMDAGMAPRLMLDWLDPSSEVGNKERIHVLAPASLGYEGRSAPEMDEMIGDRDILSVLLGPPPIKGQCTFLEKGLCTIHTSGFKPRQCCTTRVCTDEGDDNFDIARLWASRKGYAAVARWRELMKEA